MIRRLSSLVVALWFALYVGAPQLLHPCPQHAVSGVLGNATTAAQQAGAAAAAHESKPMDGAGTSVAHHHGAPPSSDGTPAPAGGHDCCCPGPQCGTSGVPVAIQTSWIEVTLVDASVPIAAPPLHPASSRVAYTLPYATAPPAAALA